MSYVADRLNGPFFNPTISGNFITLLTAGVDTLDPVMVIAQSRIPSNQSNLIDTLIGAEQYLLTIHPNHTRLTRFLKIHTHLLKFLWLRSREMIGTFNLL